MKEDSKNKPYFRSAAKRAAFEYLEQQLKKSLAKIRSNKLNMVVLAREQTELKKDAAALNQLMQEFLK